MIKINKHGKLWKNATDEEKMAYCNGLYDSAKQHMTKRHYEWYMNRMFKEGHHYVQYNTTTNALERPPRARGEVRAVVNKVRSVTRAIQNFATREEPKWVITPGDLDEDTIKNAIRVGKFMDYLYRRKMFEVIIDGAVESSMDTSVAWTELVWDDKDADGQGDVKYILHDSFDIFTDPKGYFDEGRYRGRFLFKAVSKTTDEIMNDERYDKKSRKKVVPDEELAASEMKARIIRKESGGWGDALPSATVKEFFLWDDEKNGEGGNLIRFTYGGGQVLREEELEDTEYPMYAMQLPLDPKTIYHRSWTADAIPLNKILDRTLSQKVMYVNQALIYRIIAEKGHGANVGTLGNEQGEIIEVNKNRKFEQWQMAGLPAALDSLNGDVLQLIEDILGAHDSTFGRVPTGARSGDMIEALQAGDANNLAGISKSLKVFLKVIGKATINMIAKKYTASRIAEITEPEGGEKYMKVVGEGASENVKDKEKMTIVTSDSEVNVSVGSWLGYTRESQRETLLKMAEAGLVPAEEVLRQFQFPNIEELSEKARNERLEQHEMKAEIAGRTGGGGAGVPVGGMDAQKMKAMADKENTAMANGEPLPPTEGADMNMVQAHLDFMQTQIFAELPPEIQQNIQAHVQGEMQALGIRR